MRAWTPGQENQNIVGGQVGGAARFGSQQQQRMRPKKLPCGHILHFACLRSWLERQQRCPTCRRPVLETTQAIDPNDPNNANRQQPGGQPGPGGRGIAWGGQFGGIRVNFGVGQGPEFMQNVINQWEQNRQQGGLGIGPGMGGNAALPQVQQGQLQQNIPGAVPLPQNNQPQQPGQPHQPQNLLGLQQQQQGLHISVGMANLVNLHNQLLELERSLRRELEAVERTSAQVQVVRNLQGRLNQYRGSQPGAQPSTSTSAPASPPAPAPAPAPAPSNANPTTTTPTSTTTTTPTTQPNLPPGVTLPPGWNLIPVARATTLRVPATSNSPALDVIDLRRRRFGRGDVRVYSSNLRDWHANRTPGVERSEQEGGLSDPRISRLSTGAIAGSSTPSASSTGHNNNETTPTNTSEEMSRRASSLLNRTIAIEESSALIHSVMEALRGATAPVASTVNSTITTYPANSTGAAATQMQEEEISRAEREVQDAEATRRELVIMASRMLSEAEALLNRITPGSQSQQQQQHERQERSTESTSSNGMQSNNQNESPPLKAHDAGLEPPAPTPATGWADTFPAAAEAQPMSQSSSSSSHVNVEMPTVEENESGVEGGGAVKDDEEQQRGGAEENTKGKGRAAMVEDVAEDY